MAQETTIDVSINDFGSIFSIVGESEAGVEWIEQNVQGGENGTAYAEHRYIYDITEGAHDEGLVVHVDGRLYLGNGLAQAA